MIYIRTFAYNAEKTLKRAVESVLNQTYRDFKYYILDNGSTDGTRNIIRNYAKRDKRIIPFYSSKNHDYTENLDFWNLPKNIPENSFFCVIDADDFYETSFFEEMLCFMEENQLEMAACGTEFFEEESGCAVGGRILAESLIIDQPEKWNLFFSKMYWNLRQVWGKLYSGKVAAARYEVEKPEWFPSYGGDTINVFQSAAVAKRFGIYAKKLHHYCLSAKSVSHKWMDERETADVILYEKAIEFLEQKCGIVSDQNRIFLYLVYWSALHDTIDVLVCSQLSPEKQITVMCNMICHDITKQMFASDMSAWGIGEKEKRRFQREIIHWLNKHAGEYSEKILDRAMEIYLQFNPDFSQFIPKGQLLWYLRRMPQVVETLALCEYENTLDFLEGVLAGEDVLPFAVQLAQSLAALLQRQEAYVLYEKLYIGALIRQGDLQLAEAELAEWERILPEDGTLVRLRRQLEEKKGRNR